MLFFKKLQRCLSKIVSLVLQSGSHGWLLDLSDVEVTCLVHLIGNLTVGIETINCVTVPLLVPEDVVDPRV
jgi:hypothetical protein